MAEANRTQEAKEEKAQGETSAGQESLEGGSYEVLHTRLLGHAGQLKAKASQLNERRKQTFGGTELSVIANERVRTENNCIPCDIAQVGGHLLFAYNVFFGLKKQPELTDVFSLHSMDLANHGQAFSEVPTSSVPGLFVDSQLTKDFADLYRYYKGTKLLRLKITETKLFAVFQIGESSADIKVFHWDVLATGGFRYVDSRGDRAYTMPASHDFVWKETTRDDQVQGLHPHVSIAEQVFVETVGGDLTIKLENNTEDGLGIYSEAVDEPEQILDDAKIHYALLGSVILIKVLPYREETWRYFIFNSRTKHVVRIDAIGQSCVQLPEDHGIIFPGGYYLRTGEHKQFGIDTSDLEFEKCIRSPNGEDALYVFHHHDEGRYVLLAYNLIRKEVQSPIHCHGYSLFADGKMIVFRMTSEEATRIHPVQVWQTPFTSAEYAALAPTDGSYLAKVGNAELVRGISEVYSVIRLAESPDPRRETYEDLLAATSNLLDNYYWLNQQEVGNFAETLSSLREVGELIIDEFEKVLAIRKRAEEALAEIKTKQEQLIKKIRPDEWKTVDAYMGALTELRTHRGALITLRELKAIHVAAIDELEQQTIEQYEKVSHRCVDYLVQGEALVPITNQLSELLTRIEAAQDVPTLEREKQDVERLGEGLQVLADVVRSLQVGDATSRTKILEQISEVMAHHGRVRATLQTLRKQLGMSEGKAEFAAQFKLFAQAVSSAIAMADSPERCDELLTQLLVQLEELEGRFSEFDEFIADLANKREEVHDAFSARKQALLDERQARVQHLLTASQRILEGIVRRGKSFDNADELNAYFAADAMVIKLRDLIEKLRALGAGVKADEIGARLQSARQDALRGLRDRLDLYEDGAGVIKLGRHRFSVNTQVLDLTMVPHEGGMAVHIGGTDFFTMVDDPFFQQTSTYWSQQIVSETDEVYRGEYLAASLLFAAESGKNGLSLSQLEEAQLSEEGILKLVRKFAADRYDEGYDRGVHDVDASHILDRLIHLRTSSGLLRISPNPRAWACLFWAFDGDKKAKSAWHRQACSIRRIRETFHASPAAAQMAVELQKEIAHFLSSVGIQSYTEQDSYQAGVYLVEELGVERPRFVTSAKAMEVLDAFKQSLEKTDKRRSLEEDIRALEGRLREQFELAKAWLQAFIVSDSRFAGEETLLVEAAVILLTERLLEREVQSAVISVEVSGLLGQHPRIKNRTLELRFDEFLSRLSEFIRTRVPGFLNYRQQRHAILERERARLKLEEFTPKVLSSFVRNRLVNEVYLPLIGDNLAKQLGAMGNTKRTDQMGMLLLISPPGYGKTTLMEYVASRLGLIFMKINGPALGHDVVSLDPATAPNAAAAQEITKIGLALEMGNNVMLYLDDIQHTNSEFLQKFISLCDGQRRIEGVWNGKTRTYDLRGKKFCVVMAGNPYTESGATFKIPDMLANRADTYNLGDILGGKEEAFALSYIENTLTSNSSLAPLASREQSDLYRFIRMAKGEEVASSEFSHDYSVAEVQDILAVLRHLFRVRDVLLRVNKQYIESAARNDAYRQEPPFKLQGSYRNMNKLAEKIVPAMTVEEVELLIDDHYLGEAQTLTIEAEQNMLKLKELRGRLSSEQAERWQHINKEFARNQSLGGAEDDPAIRVLVQLSLVAEHLKAIQYAVHHAAELGANSQKHSQSQLLELAKVLQDQTARQSEELKQSLPTKSVSSNNLEFEWMRPQIARLVSALQSLANKPMTITVQNEAPPGIPDLIAQQVAIIDHTLIPLVRAATANLTDIRGLEEQVKELLGAVKLMNRRLEGRGAYPI